MIKFKEVVDNNVIDIFNELNLIYKSHEYTADNIKIYGKFKNSNIVFITSIFFYCGEFNPIYNSTGQLYYSDEMSDKFCDKLNKLIA